MALPVAIHTMPPGSPRPTRGRAWLAWAPVVVLGLALVGALRVQPGAVFDPPLLLAALNLVFLTVLPAATAVLAVAAYRRTGVGAILAIGAGVLATAIGAGALPAVLLWSLGTNALVTIHNGTVLVAALCHGSAALGGALGLALGRHRRRHVAIAYGAVAVAIGGLVGLYVAGALPVFWTQDGATAVRQEVLGTAVALLGISAFAWWEVGVRDRRIRFLDWYVPGLVLFALGVVGVMSQSSVGGVVGWLGRTGQYLAAMYMLIAVLPESRGSRGAVGDQLGVALLQAALPFRPLVESSTDGIVALGRTGRIVYWNEAARALFGYAAGEVFDAEPADLLAPANASPAERAQVRSLLGAASAAVGTGAHDLVLGRRDGSRVPVELTVFASPDDNRLVVCVIRDVTERIRAREELEARVRQRTAELEQLNADLEQANRAKDEFLGLVSHELRTPITTILAAGSIMGRHTGVADPYGLSADIVAEASRLAGIVDNLLALARLDTGRPAEREPIALDRILAHAVAGARRDRPDREITLLAPKGIIVEGNDAQLEMVVGNYLANALKYSPPGAPVEVELAASDGLAEVSVRDRGTGIDPDEAQLLFEPFHRGNGTATTPGIGIGLTVCRRIVESLGGTVAAAPRADGPGSAFTFTLPLLDAGPDEPRGHPASERPGADQPAGPG